MTGTYKIPADKINEMKGVFRFSFIKFIVIAYVGFMLIAVLRNEPDLFVALLVVTGVFAGFLLLFLIINVFQHRPIYNTIIQITENEIIRSGEDVLTVRLRYDEIGTVSTKDIGTVLVKKGALTSLDFYTAKYPYSNTAGVILIPLSIENYQKLVSYVRERVK